MLQVQFSVPVSIAYQNKLTASLKFDFEGDLAPSLLNQIIYFIILAVLRRSCNELVGPNSASLRQGNTTFETLQGWRAVGNTVSDLNVRPPDTETNALPFDQLVGNNFDLFASSAKEN